MGLLEIILGIVATALAGLNIYQLIAFKALKEKYTKEAEKDAAEAEEAKQSALERRLEAMEELYKKQGEEMDRLRNDIIALKKEKFASDKRIVQLESENKTLKETVGRLDEELKAYKTIAHAN